MMVEVVALNNNTSAMVWLRMANVRSPASKGGVLLRTEMYNKITLLPTAQLSIFPAQIFYPNFDVDKVRSQDLLQLLQIWHFRREWIKQFLRKS